MKTMFKPLTFTLLLALTLSISCKDEQIPAGEKDGQIASSKGGVASVKATAKITVPGANVTTTAPLDPGNPKENVVDGSTATRWSGLGNPQSITLNLGAIYSVDYVKIAFHTGGSTTRTSNFDIAISPNGTSGWVNVVTNQNSAPNNTALQTFNFNDVAGQYVRITGHGNSQNLWNSYTEIEVWGSLPNSDPPGTVVWRGGFETGNLSQYSSSQRVAADRLQVVTTHYAPGLPLPNNALRVEVRDGDDPIGASGDRAELVKHDGSTDGSEYYYQWNVLWPAAFQFAPTWHLFTQWHHSGLTGSPPLEFTFTGNGSTGTQALRVLTAQQWTHPITLGVWHTYRLHIKWSSNPSVGFIELWYDGNLVIPRKYLKTMYVANDVHYMKLGLYRNKGISHTQILYHDGMVQTTP